MATMYHQIKIRAPSEAVYEALTTQDGLRSWWTDDAVAEQRTRSIVELGFSDRTTVFRMRVDKLMWGKRIVWTCLGDVEAWKDTRLTWELKHKDEMTVVRFAHDRWKSATGMFATCNTTWGVLMYRLRDYVEGRSPGPFFKG